MEYEMISFKSLFPNLKIKKGKKENHVPACVTSELLLEFPATYVLTNSEHLQLDAFIIILGILQILLYIPY